MRPANPARGEAAILVGGERVVLRPSFEALVAAEEELGSLFALVERAADGRLALSEMARALHFLSSSRARNRRVSKTKRFAALDCALHACHACVAIDPCKIRGQIEPGQGGLVAANVTGASTGRRARLPAGPRAAGDSFLRSRG